MTNTIRNALLAGGAALILSTGIAAAAPATAQADLNVRSGPSARYPVVGGIRAGEAVDVAGCSGSWCQVSFPGGSGFAKRSYLALAGGAPSVGVAVAPGYTAIAPGYTYEDNPAYADDDYAYDNNDYGYDYGPSVGFFVGPRFHHRRDFDRDRHWNGTRTGTWQGNRTGTPTGTWQGRAGFTGNRVGNAAPGSVAPFGRGAPNVSAPTGMRSGPAPSGGGHVGSGGGGHASGGAGHHR